MIGNANDSDTELLFCQSSWQSPFFFFNVNTQCRQVSREMVLSYTAGKDINSSISLEGNKAILSYVLKLCTAFDLEVNTGAAGGG